MNKSEQWASTTLPIRSRDAEQRVKGVGARESVLVNFILSNNFEHVALQGLDSTQVEKFAEHSRLVDQYGEGRPKSAADQEAFGKCEAAP